MNMCEPVGPEDLKIGMWVVPMSGWHVREDSGWCTDRTGEVLQVEAVCLPFVVMQNATGQLASMDVRRVQLARVPKAYARRVQRLVRLDKHARCTASIEELRKKMAARRTPPVSDRES